MKILIALMTMALPLATMAETATLTVEGMHCGGCAKILNKAVCEDKKISTNISECKITVDDKTKIGTVILKSKTTKNIEMALVEKAITSTGEEYKISKKEIIQ